jgi:AraC-like DNA-binding protein
MGNFMLSALLAHGHDIRRLQPAKTAMLHCRAVAAGYEQRRNEVYSWDGLARDTTPFLVLQHTTLGEGRLDYSGTHYRLHPGQTMLVTIPHAHRYWLERGGQWEYFWLVLSGREALRLAREILDAAGPVLTPNETQTDRLAAACLTLLTQNATPGEASSAAYSAMSALHDAAFATRAPDTSLPLHLTRVTDYIESHLAEPLTIPRLAQIAGLSRAHFTRQFTAALGQPPSDHTQSRRLERVGRLLLATEMKVSDIARATGFADPNYLAKVFRKHRGLSPLAFRATRAEAT